VTYQPVQAPLLEMRGIVKRFPGVLALGGVDLDVRPGEVHCLLGQNGAGKSTLIKVLSASYQPEEGEIRWEGEPVTLSSPQVAMGLGISTIYQELDLVAGLSVAENIFLGHEKKKGLFLDDAAMEREAAAALAAGGLQADPRTKVRRLIVGEKQWVEILKALYGGARILILDEPTSALTPPEVRTLLNALQVLVREQGSTVLLVTHKLPIVLRASDMVTVLRSGRVVAHLKTQTTTEEELVRHMIGRDVSIRASEAAQRPRRPVLEVEGLSAYNDKGVLALRDVSFVLCEGEILGIAGVTGNGQDELAQVLSGLRPAAAGRVRFEGRDITHATPLQRWRVGIWYIPAERTTVGSIPAFSLVENTGLGYHFDPAFTRRGVLDYQGLERITRHILTTYDVKAPHPYVSAQHLSGGNLQKLVLGRVLLRRPRLLIAHLPTQGLDVEAAAFVRARILEAKAEGAAILLISEDLDEILSLSDRIAPMYEGRLVAILPRGEADPETVGAMMAGLRPKEAVR